MNGEWDDSSLQFSLTTYGFTITGTLNVEDNLVHVDGQLPFAAVAFRGKIQQAIEQELSRALA